VLGPCGTLLLEKKRGQRDFQAKVLSQPPKGRASGRDGDLVFFNPGIVKVGTHLSTKGGRQGRVEGVAVVRNTLHCGEEL